MSDIFSTIVEWDVGGGYFLSFEGLRSPSQNYAADLMTIGAIRRSVGPINESYSTGNVSMGLIDRGRQFAIEKASSIFKNTDILVKFGAVSGGLAAMSETFTGVVDTHEFSNGVLTLNNRDTAFDRFKQPLRTTLKTLTPTVFPNLDEGLAEVLVPVVYGDLSGAGTLREGGPIPCYRIDGGSGGKYRYVVAQHVMKSITAIFVYGDANHGITTTVVYANYDGVTMTCIDFDTDPFDPARPNEIEVTCKGRGMTDDGTSSGTLITNVADIHNHLMLNYVGFSAGELDSTLYTAASDAADDNEYGGNSAPYVGAVVLLGDINQDWFSTLDRMTKSWLLYTYWTVAGKLGVYLFTYTEATASLTPDISVTDSEDIIARSLRDAGNVNIYSAVHYQWVYNFAVGKFVISLTSTGTSQIERKAPRASSFRTGPLPSLFRTGPVRYVGGTTEGAPTAEPSVADARPILKQLHYVYDPATARSVANVYALLAKEGVRFATFDLPARFIGQIDLNTKVGLTHFLGIDASGDGYSDEVFRIFSIETYLQPSQKRLRCMGIKLAA